MPRYPIQLALIVAVGLVTSPAVSADVEQRCEERFFGPVSQRTKLGHELVVTADALDDRCAKTIGVTLLRETAGDPVVARVKVAYWGTAPELSEEETMPDETCPGVRDRLLTLDEVTTGRLSSHLQKLRGLMFSPVPQPIYVQHGVTYDIWLSSPFANLELHFTGHGKPTSVPGPYPEIDAWVQELHRVLGVQCPSES